ncbi:thioredoxin family protein [Streptomyces sp. NPDC094144]|uniref:thioredoxin family protein n=1 Tax=Streptomyces sp. NPDC094144 TaxID=3366056 RepID=UPI0038307321
MTEVVFFGAAWCRPCKAARPVAERACDELGLYLEYVDVESYDSRANGITSIPTVRTYDDHGEVTGELRGNVTRDALDKLLGGLA